MVGEFFFPKSYFQQTASKICFLELNYYVYLLGKHHNMSPLNIWFGKGKVQTLFNKFITQIHLRVHYHGGDEMLHTRYLIFFTCSGVYSLNYFKLLFLRYAKETLPTKKTPSERC